MKKKILSYLILISVVVVCINIVAGIIRANTPSRGFGILLDNQTGEDITSIILSTRAYDINSGNVFENEQRRSFNNMKAGNYVEFILGVDNQEDLSALEVDLLIAVKSDIDDAYIDAKITGVPIKDGKRTLIRLLGDKKTGLKAEFVELL